MSWFKREDNEIVNDRRKTVRTEGLWVRCEGCRDVIFKAELDAKMALFDAHLKATEAQKMQRSPVPGSRKVRDGHHYVPDPKRPGKFLLVVHHA